MRKININYNSNYSIAQYIFDEIAIWQQTKNPKQTLESLIGDIEKVLDSVKQNAIKLSSHNCCRN